MNFELELTFFLTYVEDVIEVNTVCLCLSKTIRTSFPADIHHYSKSCIDFV